MGASEGADFGYISIHALLAESDLFRQNYECFEWIFLSTLSLRRATCQKSHEMRADIHFYPRSPCGERRWLELFLYYQDNISIHALLAESDIINNVIDGLNKIFLSTLSLRRATERPVESRSSILNFYPRSPCGERHLGAGKSCNVCGISIHALLAESDCSAGFGFC